MIKKKACFSMDVEDFSDIYCLRHKDTSKCPSMMDGFSRFLDLLDKYQIKATFFVLANRLSLDHDILMEAIKRGHHIGLHGYEHCLPSDQSYEDFVAKTKKAKAMIEKDLGITIHGYRAPGFSLTQKQMNALPALGFSYDASEQDYPLTTYGSAIDTSSFKTVEESVLRKGDFFEIKMPNSIGHPLYGMPIGGGGYLRLPPAHFVKRVVGKTLKAKHFFAFYCHPFEISEKPTPKVGYMGPLNLMYVKRRKHYFSLIENLICLLKDDGYSFTTYEDIVKSHLSARA